MLAAEVDAFLFLAGVSGMASLQDPTGGNKGSSSSVQLQKYTACQHACNIHRMYSQ